MINPDDLVADDFQAMGQAVAPAETQADIELGGAGAVEAGEVEGQDAVERAVGEGQQFFAGDHRYRAAVFAGRRDAGSGVVVGIFRLFRGVVAVFVLLEGSVLAGVPVQQQATLIGAGCHAARGDGFVVVDVLGDRVKGVKSRLDESQRKAGQHRTVLQSAKCQIGRSDWYSYPGARKRQRDERIDEDLSD